MNFAELGLNQWLAKRCESLEYKEPTPIQQKAIPAILSGEDMIGCAATGTGKTAAFLLPLLQKLQNKPVVKSSRAQAIQALILAPTRELATQISDNLNRIDKKTRAVTVMGGANIGRQRMELRRGATVVVATPGRLMDHLENNAIDLSQLEVLVLDEADRMLDMGFWPTIRTIISLTPNTRQTLLFSATMLPAIEELARSNMKQPKIIEVNKRGNAALTIKQTAYPVALESKTTLLFHLLERERFERVLVFTRTRRGAERLSHLLSARKHQVGRIHADRTQPQREAALRGFKNGNYRVLVATDIAARGIDVDLISHVINFDLPDAPEDYVHRIGRTGRAGNEGQAISLITPVDELSMRAIEKLTGQKVERVLLPDFGGKVAPPVKPVVPFGRKSFGSSRSFRSRRASR
ncbi:MAG: DEAD/DEAH box helicase [Acidobacteria bacterium]|nr:DEAD/DEAH box helicase [Acidobacteriota bacterium]